MTAIREALQALEQHPDATVRNTASFVRAALSQDVPQELPPLPVNRWAFFCTKCMHSCDIDPPEMVKGVQCPRCGYFGFAQEKDYTADQMRAYAKAARGEPLTDEKILVVAIRGAERKAREAAEADARRYRWLRVQGHKDIAACWLLPRPYPEPLEITNPEDFDAAIDAAIRSTQEQHRG